jgi:hypothetical protein
MWAIGVLTAAVLLVFVYWFAALALAMCVMGGYGALLQFVYDGEWTRDAEGDSVWLPKESASSEPPESPREPKERGNPMRSIYNTLFPIVVVALLAFTVIDTFIGK